MKLFLSTAVRTRQLMLATHEYDVQHKVASVKVPVDWPRPKTRIGGTSGRNSVAECQLPKLDVAGSNPVGRSKLEGVTAPAVAPFRMFGAHPVPAEAADGLRQR